MENTLKQRRIQKRRMRKIRKIILNMIAGTVVGLTFWTILIKLALNTFK